MIETQKVVICRSCGMSSTYLDAIGKGACLNCHGTDLLFGTVGKTDTATEETTARWVFPSQRRDALDNSVVMALGWIATALRELDAKATRGETHRQEARRVQLEDALRRAALVLTDAWERHKAPETMTDPKTGETWTVK